MILLLLATVALSGEPERPVLDEVATDACPAVDIKARATYTSPCDAVVLSLAQMSWFAEMAVYADEMHDLRRLDTVSLTEQLKYADQRADFYKAVAERPALPEKLTIAPAGWFGMGVGAGVIAVIGGAVAVRWASEVQVTSTAQ